MSVSVSVSVSVCSWETESVSTTKSGKSKSSKRGKSKERKKIDFSLVEEAVKVSDAYGHVWDKRFAQLEANRLCLFKGSKAPATKDEKPKREMLLDGLIVDESEKKNDTVFIVKSLFASSTEDLLIHFSDAKTAKVWKERLQAASFFHNMPREKQLLGLVGGKPKGAAAPQRVDEYGNRLSTTAPKHIPFHDIPVERSPPVVPAALASAAQKAAAAGGTKGVAKSVVGNKAAAHFRGPVKSFTIIGMEIRNASMAFEEPFLAVGIFGTGGTLKLSLPDIPLKGGESKAQMRFDIGAKASVPDESDAVLFFELRHKIKGKEQGPKYWTCALLSTLGKGRHDLQVYKAPVEYAMARQKRQVKENCFLKLMMH